MSSHPLVVGMSPSPAGWVAPGQAFEDVAAIADAGITRLVTADHVSFRGGAGNDALVQLAVLAASDDRLEAYVGVYLLALRHPVVVARQLATVALMLPGRITLGVGVGGEDRDEIRAVGIDPATRGRRTDEALEVLRALATGEAVTHRGEFFDLDEVAVRPAPDPRVLFPIGGRADAALRRAGRLGDGWLAAWVSPERFAAGVATVAAHAEQAGRTDHPARHGYQVWCGVGDDAEEAAGFVGPAMEAFYKVPFKAFAKTTPVGTPEQCAEFLRPYVAAGAVDIHLTPVGADRATEIAAAAEIQSRLREETPVTAS